MKLNSNIKGFPLYHVTKDGKVYNIRYIHKIKTGYYEA